MHVPKITLLSALSASLLVGLCACDKSGDTPGEKLDRALDKTGEKVKEAGDAIKSR